MSPDEQRDLFLATVSHELRTPLTSIAGYAEMLADGDAGQLSEEQLRIVEVIDRNTRRLQGLIEDMLVLSQIDASEYTPSRASVDISQLAETVVEDLDPTAQRKNIAVTLHTCKSARVEGDSGHLLRALTNLLGNALKFTPEGGTVDVSVTTVGSLVQAAVADSGIGIPESQIAELFDRFFRATNATGAAIPGTGLGLSIVAAIADEHHGQVSVTSTEGEGSTFQLDLPALDAPEDRA